MSNDLLIFKNEEFGQIRTVEVEGKIYFVGSDVARALGYEKPANAVAKHCRYTLKQGIPHPQNPDKQMEVNVIPEGDMYRLITHSKLESAERFESWVFDEVLPQIHQTGGYIPIDENESNEEILAKAFLIANDTIKQKDKIIAQKDKQLTDQKPLVDFAEKVHKSDGLIDIGDMAKLLYEQNKIDIGRNRLFEFLRNKKILMVGNEPYQKYIEAGWFKTKEYVLEIKGKLKPYIKVYVTGKGQLKITQLVMDNYNNLLDPAS